MHKFQLVSMLALSGALEALPSALRQAPLAARASARVKRQTTVAVADVVRQFNGALYQDTPDRHILENLIFPYYQLSAAHRSIVFAGCDWYTEGYQRRFSHKSYMTLDPNPARAKFGAGQHHCAPLHQLAQLGPLDSVDAVFCNGVIGWGLDTLAEAEQSFRAVWDALRPGGDLIVGYNDKPPHNPFRLAEVPALARFEPFIFEPLGQAYVRVDDAMAHEFHFLRKPVA